MKPVTAARFSTAKAVLLAGFSVVLMRCDYHGEVVNPGEPAPPIFTLQGRIAAEFSDDVVAQSKSLRIGLMPELYYDNSCYMYTPAAHVKYDRDFGTLDTTESVGIDYPSVVFSGEFPMKFISEFKSLPVGQTIHEYRGPSGKKYRLGMYTIGLFDDIDRNGSVRLIRSGSDPRHYSPGSDELIGICRDHFVIFVEDSSMTMELNTFINSHIGPHAQWHTISTGFNLVSFTEPFVRDTSHYYGVTGCPQTTELRIEPFELRKLYDKGYRDSIPASFYSRTSLFYFQNDFFPWEYGCAAVEPAPGIDTIRLKTGEDRWNVHIRSDSSTLAPADSRFFKVYINGYGMFDYGYITCLNMMFINDMTINRHGQAFTIEGLSCSDSSRLTDPFDTLALQDDTLSIDRARMSTGDCGGPSAPLWIDSVNVFVYLRPDAPFTVVSVK